MKRLILFVILVFITVSCGSSRHAASTTSETYGYTRMYYSMNKTITISQVDSMIVVDKLADLDKWPVNVSGDRNKQLVQYYFIKSLDKNRELIYILTQTQIDTVFRCAKRVTKEIE